MDVTFLSLSTLTTAAKTGVLAACLQQSPNATPVSSSLPAEVCADAVKPVKQSRSPEVRALVERHLTYLRAVSSGPRAVVSRTVARVAAKAWLDVSDATGNALPVPAACTGPDGQIM